MSELVCDGCGEKVSPDKLIGSSHARIEYRVKMRTGHEVKCWETGRCSCNGVPVPSGEADPYAVECGPVHAENTPDRRSEPQ